MIAIIKLFSTKTEREFVFESTNKTTLIAEVRQSIYDYLESVVYPIYMNTSRDCERIIQKYLIAILDVLYDSLGGVKLSVDLTDL